jgi:hypothetical protein
LLHGGEFYRSLPKPGRELRAGGVVILAAHSEEGQEDKRYWSFHFDTSVAMGDKAGGGARRNGEETPGVNRRVVYTKNV